MTKSKPTKEEIKIARKVLRHFQPQANKLAKYTEQEQPSEWADALEVAYGLLGDGAEETMNDYLDEYKAGR